MTVGRHPVRPERLVVITHVPHFRGAGQWLAYGPYARELEAWCNLFEQVVIAAPIGRGEIPGDCLPIARANVRLHPVPQTGGLTWGAKLAQLALLPLLVWRLSLALLRADAVHVRCPGNLGLLGVLLAPLFCRQLIAKYAGQWTGYPGEPRTARWQRQLLGSRWWRGLVTVYGKWPGQPPHVIPFFTSIMDAAQVEQARQAAEQPRSADAFRVLYVGRLSRAKNVDALLRAAAALAAENVPIYCEIVGTGPEEEPLRRLAEELGITERVHFAGGVDFDDVLRHYAQAHALALVSETEGWPKAIAEAMAFGVACVGSDRGLVPWMLSEGRGRVIPPGDSAALAAVLRELARDPEATRAMGRRAAEWGQKYSLDGLEHELARLLAQHWDRAPGAPAAAAAGATSMLGGS